MSARIHIMPGEGPLLAREQDINDFLSEAWALDAELLAIPVSRLSPDFFRLATGLAGAVTQMFVKYDMRLAIIGDIAGWEAESRAFRDFVREANRGRHLLFVPDEAALDAALARQAA